MGVLSGLMNLRRSRIGSIWLIAFLLLAVCAWTGSARAAVEIGFHSKDFGATFPHAYISLSGTLDSNGERVDANYGFTVRHTIGPTILFRRVHGVVISESAAYVASGNHHFSMTLTDEQYRRVMDLVEQWRAMPQPSYSLDRRNCVSFVAEVAALLGLQADPRGFMRRPKAFLNRVRQQNFAIIAAASGTSNAAASHR